ncbi:hypothetical protein EDD22DRAFT_962951 [Suillus occidentalis]|nr:hypothetical protein EDD22DRAFT_962951 [Suillus occidentalis]
MQRNTSAGERRKTLLPWQSSTASSSRPPKPNAMQRSSTAPQTQPSLQPQPAVSNSSITPAVGDNAAGPINFGEVPVCAKMCHQRMRLVNEDLHQSPSPTQRGLMLTAEHGPAVRGAMNTIIATCAGKDLISSLASGLLTIRSRFGGALDEAASMRTSFVGVSLSVFAKLRLTRPTVSGIGHKIKSVNNPDLRMLVYVKAKLILF